MAVIADWTSAKAERFTQDTLHFSHELHTRPMFDDAGLEALLDAYPRDKLGVFTMGHDPVDWTTWRRGSPGDLTGAQLLEAAQKGRIWLNLRHTNLHLPQYADLCDEIFADKTAASGVSTFKRDLGVLISSANAHVFYHLDVPLVSLWQIRGEKQVYVYPPGAPYIEPEALERIVLRDTAEQTPFDPAWDAGAQSVRLKPGAMVTWPQNAPHRIVNGPMLNVSLSIEFMTPAALLRANVLYANGVLRQRLGREPLLEPGAGAANMAKLALARMVKASGLQKPNARVLPVSFTLDPREPGVPQPLDLRRAG
jgi:hypothetical protein